MKNWVAVCLAADLPAATASGTRLMGTEIALWRAAGGGLHAWTDRCPHRGMRMSFGFVRGERLACIYHGWQFDQAGICRAMPAHPEMEVPENIRIPRYAVAESASLVWIWPGLDEMPPDPPAPIAALPIRSLQIAADAATVQAALAEFPPPAFRTDGPPSPAPADLPILRSEGGADCLVAAVQPLTPDLTAVHMSVLGPDSAYRGAGQAHFARHLEALRRRFTPAIA